MPRFTMPRLQTLSKPKFLNGIPNNSIFAIATLIAVNALVWIAAGIVLHFHPRLISPAALSYVLIGNGWVLYKLIQRLQAILQERRNQVRLEGFVEEETQIQDHFALEGGGFLTRVFKRLFRVIDRPWKMYPLGVVFGLGFDTSSEIAILGIASIQAVQGTSI
ncbi:hypothetical protein H9Q72_000468 [Fusarium xylarioides]|uniref:Nickel/cobalt efflux system n=1 Tax=Fusarium xylarioides TaxID=221167 RepID=A0A9P7LFD2_9HYPO|nr:hypothetical protein H9Q72_000468 [Fusarium xylarioides]